MPYESASLGSFTRLIKCQFQLGTLLRTGQDEISTRIVHGQIVDEQTSVEHDVEILQTKATRVHPGLSHGELTPG